MNVLVLGSEGFLGSQLTAALLPLRKLAVSQYHRGQLNGSPFPHPIGSHIFLNELMEITRPKVIINCLVVKPIPEEKNINLREMYSINSELPHQLSSIAAMHGARVIQISTDAVFSGETGSYDEDSLPDPKDDYGKSKFLGELHDNHTLTIRCSIIGRHQTRPQFMDWVIDNKGPILGYANYIFSPITSDFLIRVIIDNFLDQFAHYGILHLGCHAISKFDLISFITAQVNNDIELIRTETPNINRSLKSLLALRKLGIAVPNIYQMIINNLRINLEE
jgi:dTDP-4-dehydrorhamnose reductase